ncbi:hypothetical protein RJ639_003287 [Escallonia herrerae]|uniref:GTD-binding domain-containing protein n=1 Tax=Escallonia herrerae TaxID=1293975 RepID=A0AA88W3B2_9ASTE|nr:hypothetical protein RJ639_003287 [Escallonia herrerae]
MAANKFATMLHRNTNRITLILIYAVLEWTLIVLLLLNSLFSYLIIKFADYFGLKPPCLWCSRVDHFFEPQKKNNNTRRELLCELHSAEISNLGYCSNHQKLAAYQDMCEDCSSSRPDFRGRAGDFTFFPWVEDKIDEEVVEKLECSCCGVKLEKKIQSNYFVIKPSWGALDYTQKGSLIIKEGADDHSEDGDHSDQSRSDCFEINRGFERNIENLLLSDGNKGFGTGENDARENSSVSVPNFGLIEMEGNEDDKEGVRVETERETAKEDNYNMEMDDPMPADSLTGVVDREYGNSLGIQSQHLEFFIDFSGHQLVPIELIDSISEDNQSRFKVEEGQENDDSEDDDLGHEAHVEREAVLSEHENAGECKVAVFESMKIEETDNSLVFRTRELDSFDEQVDRDQVTETPPKDIGDVHENAVGRIEEGDSNAPTVSEEVAELPNNETDADVSIGTEIPDLDSTDEVKGQDTLSTFDFMHEVPSTSSARFYGDNDHGSEKAREETMELKTLSVEANEQVINNLNEIEEEKVPDTPTSMESFTYLHKKIQLLERKESGTEESLSLDGSIVSEFENGDAVTNIERLKSALRAERKALHVLYTELEEERSASAIAANQTMAMINRLQEEKAAMQMEALQYQRMMEEQSEYDQEALQLLNELMVKREREKQEVEKELEIYRRKVVDYEAKERVKMLRRRSGFSSSTCSNAEESDGLSIELNQDAKEEEIFSNHQESGNQNTPIDAVVDLEDSLTDFEEERVSILEQLKVLEEKLFTLSDEEEHDFEHLHEENGNYLSGDLDCGDENEGMTNGFSKESNGKHYQEKRILGSKGKRLLPLFDAITGENEGVILNGHHENGFDANHMENTLDTRFHLENKRVGVEVEVDQLYERLQALEADREFLKHCISSLKKGDKGMDLLQEILQHLRDLRNVELRVKNFSDGPLV